MADKKKGAFHLNPAHKGLLHEEMGIASDKPIPLSRIKSALKGAGPKEKKRLIFAENEKEGKFHHKK